MSNNLTELVFILDRSGSMGGLEADTIGGFNAMLKKQKQEPGRAILPTVLFDDRCEVLHDRVDIDKVPEMTEKEYYVRGSTALLDAVGGAIHHIGLVHKYARPEDRPDKTVFVITTDGCENASREYSYRKVKQMVQKEEEQYGWEFLFLGANMDAIAAADHFGIRAERAVRFENDSRGVQLNYETVCDAVTHLRAGAPLAADWKANIEDDFRKRGKK